MSWIWKYFIKECKHSVLSMFRLETVHLQHIDWTVNLLQHSWYCQLWHPISTSGSTDRGDPKSYGQVLSTQQQLLCCWKHCSQTSQPFIHDWTTVINTNRCCKNAISSKRVSHGTVNHPKILQESCLYWQAIMYKLRSRIKVLKAALLLWIKKPF